MSAVGVGRVVGVRLSIAGGRGQKRIESKSAEAESGVEETRQTSTGRPLRECREKVGFNYLLGNS